VGFCATIIERRRDAASAVQFFWPYDGYGPLAR
jgi:hypothetical protein